MAVLVGDRERDRAAHELQRHYREGRLSLDELAQRLETALRARNGGQLRAALSQLPAPQRQAIELAFFDGLTQAEIAAAVGDPLGTVKSRIRIGMQRLREVLLAAGIDEVR